MLIKIGENQVIWKLKFQLYKLIAVMNKTQDSYKIKIVFIWGIWDSEF